MFVKCGCEVNIEEIVLTLAGQSQRLSHNYVHLKNSRCLQQDHGFEFIEDT